MSAQVPNPFSSQGYRPGSNPANIPAPLYLPPEGGADGGNATAPFSVFGPDITLRPLSQGVSGPAPGFELLGAIDEWYRIIIAIVILYLLMRYYPKWGIPLGWLIVAGAVLATPQATDTFASILKAVQSGSYVKSFANSVNSAASSVNQSLPSGVNPFP